MREMQLTAKFKATTSATVGLFFANVAAAQNLDAAPGVQDLALLSRVINWSGILSAMGIIFVAWLLLRFVDRLVDDLGRAIAEHRLTFQRLNAFFHFFVYLATFVTIILVSFDFSAQVLALFGGAAVVAVGFATRDLLASLVAGVLIIFDRPFQLGDRVGFGGEYGDIQSIGLRSVKLRTLDDRTVTIPNNLFLSEVSSSSNSGLLEMQTVVNFYIGLDQDVQKARELLRESAATSRYIYLPRPIDVLAWQQPLDGCIAMQMQVKAYVLDTKYEKDFQTDVVMRAHQAFERSSILPPICLTQGIAT
ncbi:MAG: small-conductance mechanosensitive channel [Woeseiaceae bacterium]|jgi:small-conductance mechanosensitive channel